MLKSSARTQTPQRSGRAAKQPLKQGDLVVVCATAHTHTAITHTNSIYLYIYAGIYSAFFIFFLPCALLIFYFWRAQMLQLSRQHRNPLRNCARVYVMCVCVCLCVEACACVCVCVVQLPTYPYPLTITVNSATNSWKPA